MNRFLKSLVFLVLFLAAIVVWLLNFHMVNGVDEASNHCRATNLYVSGSDTPIFGSEDLEIDYENGLAFISAYDRALVTKQAEAGDVVSQGGMYVWDLNAFPPDSARIEVREISTQVKEDVEFRPHGISMLAGPGWRRFFVVNHAYPLVDGMPQHQGQVLVLDYIDGQLQLAEQVTASNMCSPNDVVSLGPNQFLVTNDHGACDAKGKFREEMLGKKASYLLYWNGDGMSKVAGGFAYANGVSISPNDPTTVYLTTTREDKLYSFDRKQLLEGNMSGSVDRIALPFSPDNMTWDQDGRLIIAGFPNLYRFAAYRAGVFGITVTPAIAMAIKDPGFAPKQKLLFNNETGLMRGATVAAIYNGFTIATSVFDDKILVCENNSITN